MSCPNVSSPEWLRLVSQVGEEQAWAIYNESEFIPVYAYSTKEVESSFGITDGLAAENKSHEIKQKYNNVFVTAVQTPSGEYRHIIELTSMPFHTLEHAYAADPEVGDNYDYNDEIEDEADTPVESLQEIVEKPLEQAGKESAVVQEFFDKVLEKFPMLEIERITVGQAQQMYDSEVVYITDPVTVFTATGTLTGNQQVLLPKKLAQLKAKYPGLSFTISGNTVAVAYKENGTRAEHVQAIDAITAELSSITELQGKNLKTEIKNPLKQDVSKVPAFYYKKKLYIVAENITIDTAVHEVLHPFIDAFAYNQPGDFYTLLNQILESGDPVIQDIVAEVQSEYQDVDSLTMQKEIMVRVLTPSAVKRHGTLTEAKGPLQRLKDAISAFINKVLNAFRSPNSRSNPIKDITDKRLSDVLYKIFAQEGVFEGSDNPRIQAFKKATEKSTDNPEDLRGTGRGRAPRKSKTEVVAVGLDRQVFYDKLMEKADLIKVGTFKDDGVRGNRYVLQDGTIVALRPTDFVKELFKNSNSTDMSLAEIGTEAHKWVEYFMYNDIAEREGKGLVEIKGEKVPERPTSEFSKEVLNEMKIVAALLIKDVENIQRQKNKTKYEEQLEIAAPGQVVSAVNDKAWIILETPLYVEKFVDGKDIAGTTDILVLYGDNTIDVLDHKFMKARFTFDRENDRYLHNAEVHPIKRRSAEIQMSTYKSMFVKGYGIKPEQFNRTRIIPYQMELKTKKNETPTTKNVSMMHTMANTEGLNFILASREKAQNKELDLLIQKLYEKKRNLQTQLPEYGSVAYNKINLEIGLIDRAIDEIILYHGITGVIKTITQMSAYINNNLERMTLGEMTQLSSELEFYQTTMLNAQKALESISRHADEIVMEGEEEINLTEVLREYQKSRGEDDSKVKATSVARRIIDGVISDQEAQDAMDMNAYEVGKAINHSSAAISLLRDEMLTILNEKNPAIQEVVKNRVNSNLMTFSEIDNPIFELTYNEIKFANSSIESQHAEFVKEAMEERRKLIEYGKSVGKSLPEIYRMIYDPVTGRLKRKWAKSFMEKVYKADNTDDVEFFKEHYKLKDNYQELYAAEKKRMFGIYEARYGQGSDAYNQLINDWLQKNNMRTPDAWLDKFARIRYLEFKNPSAAQDLEYLALPAPVRAYYDWYVDMNSKFNSMVPERIHEGFVANILKDSEEVFNLLTRGNFKKAAEVSQKLMTDSLKIKRGRNINIVDNASLQDMDIPLLYYDNFEYWDKEMGVYRAGFTKNPGTTEKSEDLTYNIILFSRAVLQKKHMSDIKDIAVAAGVILRDQQVYETDSYGRTIKAQGTTNLAKNPPRVMEMYNKLVLMHVGGHTVTNEDKLFSVKFLGKDRTISSNKALGTFYNMVRAMALGFNYVVGFAGGFTGYANSYINSGKRKFFSTDDWFDAQKQFMNPAMYKKNTAIADYWKIERESQAFREGLKTKSWLRRNIFNANVMYKVFQIPEEANSNILLFAMSRNYGIDPNNPDRVDRLKYLPKGTKSIHELMQVKEGKNKELEISYEGMNAKAFADFRTKVKKVSSSIKGTYTSEDMDAFQGDMRMRALMMFRRWIKPTIQNRYGKFRYDPGKQDYEVGRHNVLIGEIFGQFKQREQSLMPALLNLALRTVGATGKLGLRAFVPFASRMPVIGQNVSRELSDLYYERYIQNNPDHELDPNNPNKGGISRDHFHEIREQEYMAVINEVRVLVALKLLLIFLAGGIGSDDDDEALYKKNGFVNIGYKMLQRFNLEMLFYYSAGDFKSILQSPIPAMSFFETVFKFIGNTGDEFRDFLAGEDQLSKKGKSLDKANIGHYGLRFVPGLKHIFRTIEDITEYAVKEENKKRAARKQKPIETPDAGKPFYERDIMWPE